jgi:hypothetical protein
MSMRTLAVLQWVGLLAGAAVWAAQHLVGYGIAQAECGTPGGGRFGISNDLWQASLMGAAAALIAGAGAAAVAVLVGTRERTYEEPPPDGRIRFLAVAAVAANAIFLMIVLLDGFASIFNATCRQA